jgi:hypothetical protein
MVLSRIVWANRKELHGLTRLKGCNSAAMQQAKKPVENPAHPVNPCQHFYPL